MITPYLDMKLLLKIAVTLLIGVTAPNTYALLGETLEQTKARYGQPVNDKPVYRDNMPSVDVYQFTRPSGLTIYVMLRDNKTVALIYEHADPEKFTFTTAESVLKANYAGKWKIDTDTTVAMITKSALAGAGGSPEVFWTTEDEGAPLIALYRGAQGRLVLGNASVVGNILGI